MGSRRDDIFASATTTPQLEHATTPEKQKENFGADKTFLISVDTYTGILLLLSFEKQSKLKRPSFRYPGGRYFLFGSSNPLIYTPIISTERETMSAIDLSDSSDEETKDDTLLRCGPVFKNRHSIASSSLAATTRVLQGSVATAAMSTTAYAANITPSANKKRPATAGTKAKQALKRKCDKPHCLIWVCHHGLGRARTWSNSKLKIIGVYPSKQKAEEAKEKVMSEYENCGYGDILVGDTWEDEIDLVIREAPTFLDDE